MLPSLNDVLDENFQTETKEKLTYRKAPGISQSELKTLQYNPSKFFNKEQDNKRKEHFVLGSLTDHLLTKDTPLEEEFVFVEDKVIPTQKMLEMSEIFISQGMEITRENISLVREHVGYNLSWGMDAVEKWFNNDARIYIEIAFNNPEKTIATLTQKRIAESIVNSFQENEFTKSYFVEKENTERYFQVEIYYPVNVENPVTNKTEEVLCKAMLDMVEINTLNKTVLPIDIKTTGRSTREFGKSMKDYRYDIQATSYTYALEKLIAKNATGTLEMDLTGYTVLPFLFLVETTEEKNIGTPLPYRMSDSDMLCGYHGSNSYPRNIPAIYSNGIMLQIPSNPGWFTLLKQYLWHRDTQILNYTPKEWYQLTQHGAISSSIWN